LINYLDSVDFQAPKSPLSSGLFTTIRTNDNINMSRDEITKINSDGLRYKSKEGGSPFGGANTMATMSCYKCGLHKPRALGTFKRLLNQSMFMCGDCKPLPKAV
jgi:hypothetical protein